MTNKIEFIKQIHKLDVILNKEHLINELRNTYDSLENDGIIYIANERNDNNDTLKIYVGITENILTRFKNHHSVKLSDDKFDGSGLLLTINANEFNRSVLLHYEYELIRLFSSIGKQVKVLNNIYKDEDLENIKIDNNPYKVKYYDKQNYSSYIKPLFNEDIIENIQTLKQWKIDYDSLINKPLYKINDILYDEQQYEISSKIFEEYNNCQRKNYIINGSAGTGKTFVLLSLWRKLYETRKVNNIQRFIILTSKKSNLQMFKDYVNTYFGKSSHKIEIKYYGESLELTKSAMRDENCLILFDEAHGIFKNVGYNHGKSTTWKRLFYEGDEILDVQARCILFYDKNQRTGFPQGIDYNVLTKLNLNINDSSNTLTNLYRNSYSIYFLDKLTSLAFYNNVKIENRIQLSNLNQEFEIVNTFDELYEDWVENRNKNSRMLTTYSFLWLKNNENDEKYYKCSFGRLKENIEYLRYNSKTENFSKEEDRISYVETIQGIDLDTSWVIISKSLFVDNDRIYPNVINAFKFVIKSNCQKNNDKFKEVTDFVKKLKGNDGLIFVEQDLVKLIEFIKQDFVTVGEIKFVKRSDHMKKLSSSLVQRYYYYDEFVPSWKSDDLEFAGLAGNEKALKYLELLTSHEINRIYVLLSRSMKISKIWFEDKQLEQLLISKSIIDHK